MGRVYAAGVDGLRESRRLDPLPRDKTLRRRDRLPAIDADGPVQRRSADRGFDSRPGSQGSGRWRLRGRNEPAAVRASYQPPCGPAAATIQPPWGPAADRIAPSEALDAVAAQPPWGPQSATLAIVAASITEKD